ncbi:hypothetical protein JCM30471_32710 [Desulfuromonas carbonis]
MQQWQFFRVPVNNGAEAASEFNRFLRGARVLAVHREFVVQGESSYWALAVEFLISGGSNSPKLASMKAINLNF